MSYFSVVHQYNISYATFHLSNTDVWSMQCSLLLGRRRHGHCFCSFVRTGLIGTHSRPSRPFLCPNNVIGGGASMLEGTEMQEVTLATEEGVATGKAV